MAATKEKKKGEIKKFRLRRQVGTHGVGVHYEPNPDFDPELPEGPGNLREIEYQQGDVVKSTRDLHKIFVNKFTPFDKMERDIMAEEDEDLAADRENEAALEDTKKAAKESERLRELVKKEGVRLKEKGHGDDFDDDEGVAEQDDEFRPKVKGKKGDDSDDPEERDADEDEDADDEDVEDDEAEEEAKDVSKDFEKAKDGGLRVFKRGGSYYVHEDGEDEPMTGNKKGFTKKTDVNKFIAKQVRT